MRDSDKLQLAGPIGLIGAIACADLGAYALAQWPTSSLLWYLNLEVFRGFQYSLSGLDIAQLHNGFELTITIAIALVALIATALIGKIRLPLALASNFSFVYSLCLLYGSYLANTADAPPTFSLSLLVAPSSLLAVALLLLTSLSSTISHHRYWREIFRNEGHLKALARPAARPSGAKRKLQVLH